MGNQMKKHSMNKTQEKNRKGTYPYIANKPIVPPPSSPPKQAVLIALFPYNSSGDGDLTFKAGDLMILKDDTNPDWAFVQHTTTNETGYVPRSFVAVHESVTSEEWYFGNISRLDAEKLLFRKGLPDGTYLIRESQGSRGDFALSIRCITRLVQVPEIVHYLIKKSTDNRYYLSSNGREPKNKQTYESLKDLIEQYKNKGFRSKLTTPCPKSLPRLWDISPKTQENYEIPRSDFTMIKQLGQGNFGEVWHGKWKGHIDVAVKTLKSNSGMSNESFLAEAKIMKQCRHKNLVSLLGICTSRGPVCILTEYMSNGNLLKYMQSGEGKSLDINILIDMCAQIAKGMAYLEENHIVHRDLAARNVLVGDKEGVIPSVRVADFGLAKMFNEDYSVYISQPGGKLPIKWMAPEALFNNIFSVKSDVWSYGILLFEIFTRGGTPYPGQSNSEAMDMLKSGYRLPCPTNCPGPLYEVMKRCWAQESENRDTFEFLFNFFDDYMVSTERNYYSTTNE